MSSSAPTSRDGGPASVRPREVRLVAARSVLDGPGGGEGTWDAAYAALGPFLAERDPARALALWFGPRTPSEYPESMDRIRSLLVRDVARIDEVVSAQVDAILHHSRFQQLEASWRGLRMLTGTADRFREHEGPPVRVRILSLPWRELARDLERAIEFDQSHVFRKVYEEEFGTAGGQPYGLLLGDYEVSHRTRPGVSSDDVEVLRRMAHVCAAAFSPFVVGAQPALLGLDHFGELELPLDLARTFDLPEYLKWNAFRASEDARFVAVTLPRVLCRTPWEDDGTRADGFRYREDVSAPDGAAYLWGTAVYAFASVVVRSFGETSWPSDVRGIPQGVRGGGVVADLPDAEFATDAPGVAPKFATDVLVTDRLEKELGDLGLMPVCALRGTPWAAFYCTPSVQAARKFDKAVASANARISAMLQYMLAVSRFAHFVKILGREKIGSFATAAECETMIRNWLSGYSIADDDVSPEMKARRPLRDYAVEVREHPSKPGSYLSVIHLRPHFQLDQAGASVKLVTEFAPPRK